MRIFALSKRGSWVTHRTVFKDRIWVIANNELWHSGD